MSGDEFLSYARDVGGSPEAVVLGGGFSTSSQLAAGINAQLARSLDFEETGPGIHIGPSLIHTVLAIGQRVRATGAEMLATACVTYEINGRFHYARYDGDIQRHINVCLAMATCRLLGMDAETTNLAMGLCWGYPVRQSQLLNPPEPERISQVGMGNLFLCHDGIQAALPASHGYGEMPDELERRRKEVRHRLDGIFSGSLRLHGRRDPTQAVAVEPVVPRRHPVEPRTHGRTRHRRRGDRQDHGSPPRHLPPTPPVGPGPPDLLGRYLQRPVGHRTRHTRGGRGHEWFTDERFADPVARNMARRIEIVEDPQGSKVFADRRFHEVPNAVELQAGGRTYTRSALMSDILGSPSRPMPTEMLEDKFHRLTGPATGHDRAEVLLEALYDLASITDANDLAELF